jgi:hypothetical protein
MSRDEELKIKVTGTREGERDLDRLGDAVDDVSKSVTGLGKASDKAGKQVDDLGDEATGAARDMAGLADELGDAREAAVRAGLAFRDTAGKIRDLKGAYLGAARAQQMLAGGPGGGLGRGGGGGKGRGPGWWSVAGGMAGQVGQIGSTVGSGIAGSPVLAGTAVAGGIAAAPALGGAVGGGVIAGAALGAVGAGIAGAVRGAGGDEIRDEFGSAIDDVANRWKSSTANWVGPLLGGIEELDGAFKSLPIESVFGKARDYVKPLAEGVAGLTTGVGRGVNSLVREAGPVVERLSEEFAELGGDIAESMEAISQGAPGAADALGDLLDVTGGLIAGFGKVVLGAEHMYSALEENPLTGWGHDVFMGMMESEAEVVQQVGRTLDSAASSTGRYADVQKLLSDAANESNEAIETQLGIMLQQGEATDNAVRAVQAFKEGLEETGGVMKGNSEAALDNRDRLRDVIAAWEDDREAAIAAGGGTRDAINGANAALLGHLEELRRIMRAHGANTDELDAYIRKIKEANGMVSVVTLRTVYENIGTPGERLRSGHSRLGSDDQYAAGGDVRRTGIALVGENGPELRFLNQGDHIVNATDTRRMLSGAAGSRGGGVSPAAAAQALPPLSVLEQYLVAMLMRMMQDGLFQVPSTAIV